MSNYLDGSSFHNRRVYTQFEGREGWFCSIPGEKPVFMNHDETLRQRSQCSLDASSTTPLHPSQQRPTPQSNCIFSQVPDYADPLDVLFQSPPKAQQPKTPPPPSPPREHLISNVMLDSLIKNVDENITLNADVSRLLQMYADDLVDELLSETARAVRIRHGTEVTMADVDFALRYRSQMDADKLNNNEKMDKSA